MGTKNNPGKFDCYDKAHDDEPIFVLLGRDPNAPLLIDMWAELYELTTTDNSLEKIIAKRDEARACANAMRVRQGIPTREHDR